MKNMNSMIKNAQKIQSNMMKLKEELENKKIETSVGGGMIKIVSNGNQKILSVKIDKEIINRDDVETLEELILVATNDIINKSKELSSNEMSKITGGFKMPGML